MIKRIISLLLSLAIFALSISSLIKLFTPTTVYSQSANHIVISEIQIAGDTADDEFIELYNPTNEPIDLAEWRLRRKTATGTSETNIVSSMTGSIPAYGYFLIAPSEYTGGIQPDQTYSTSTRLTSNNVVYLYKPGTDDYELVDKIGMGEADDSETQTTVVPEALTSIERKANTNSTVDSMINGSDSASGNGEDTNNNNLDFIHRTISDPQNSASPTEKGDNTTPTPSTSPTTTPIASPTTTLTPTAQPTPTQTPNEGKVLISEIQISGSSATDEFVELYNPNNFEVSMDSWRLTRKTSTGSESNLVASLTGTIPAHGYFLISHANYDGTTQEDLQYSASTNSLSVNNTVLLYKDAGVTLLDKVGMGESSDSETSATVSPDLDQSIERKAKATSTAETMAEGGADNLLGNGYDSDNNAQDFVVIVTANPQNSNSPVEQLQQDPTPTVPVSPTPTNEVTPSPTNMPSLTPTQSPNPTVSPTITPTPTPFGRIIAYFPFSKKVCSIVYRPVNFRFFRIFFPRIICTTY